MPRKKAIEKADPQIFHVSDHATVTITWDKGYRPKFYQPSDGVVIVGEHTCQPVQRPASVEPPPSATNGPTVDTPGMIAWKNRRAKPLTPADTAREQGFPPLDFDTAQQIAASMGGGEETIVE